MAKKAQAKKGSPKKAVAKKKSDGRANRVAWSKDDVRALKAHSKVKTPVVEIAKETGRTVGSLRQQAFKLGIALGHRR
jgi:hypothetical protein